MTDDEPTDADPVAAGDPVPAPWADDEAPDQDDDDDTLRTFVIALAGLAGALVVVSLVGFATHGPRKNFIQRHPLIAEVLGMGRHPL